MSFLIFKNGGKGSHYGPRRDSLSPTPKNILPEVVVTAKYPHEQRVIDTMNASNAEFMRRLRNNDKRAIHNQDGSYSTHVLGSADNIVFPAIQDVNGELKDYRGLPWQRTLDKAIQNNDYIEFPTEGDARYFGDHYKKYFPKFFSHFGDNQYANGGYISLIDMASQHTFKDGGRVLMGQQGTNPAWSALYQSLSKKRGRLPETEVRDTINYAMQRGKELNIPYEFTRSILSNAVQESGLIHNARKGSHYGLIQATWIPINYNAKQQIDMIYDMAQNPTKYKNNKVLGYEANLLNKSYRNPSTRNFFNWTERAGVRAWNAAPRNVYDSAFDSYYKSVYANPEPVHTNPEPVVDYVSPHTVELPDALRVAKPVILPSQKLGGLLRFISSKKRWKTKKE